MTNFGHEYVWHCHILGHEENDMMRPLVLNTTPNNILWRNTSTGENVVWFMNGITWNGQSGTVTPVAPATGWNIVGVGDFNGNGQSDIVWRNANTGENVVWYMNGTTWTGLFSYIATVNPATGWNIAGVGDFTGDGKPDILWRNANTGENVIWHMNGATWTDAFNYVATVNPAAGWNIAGVGDFNSDGKPDILWRNASTGANVVWYMSGTTWDGLSVGILPSLASQWVVGGLGDFNNDVKLDILWRDTATGANMAWFLDGVTQIGTANTTPITDQNWTIKAVQ